MYRFLTVIFRLYEIIIIIRVLFSWLPVNRHQPVVRWVYALTEPLLQPLRKLIPMDRWGIDISPFLLLFALWLIQQMLVNLLFSF